MYAPVSMAPMPGNLREALDDANNRVESGDPESALDVLRTTAWEASESNSQKALVLAAAADAQIKMGESEIRRKKQLWQKAYKNYQKAVKLDSSNKDVRKEMNRLASMMDENAISLGKGFSFFDDGSPTPMGICAIFVSIMIFLVAFKYAGEALEEPAEAIQVTMEVSYVHPDDPDNRVTGEIIIELYPDDAPKHVESFLWHVDNYRYDYTIFHRVIDNFMIQGGDVENLNGMGGYSGKWFGYCNGQTLNATNSPYTETNCDLQDWSIPGEHTNGLKHTPGALAAAHAGLNTDGSQFYIVPSDSTPSHLDWEPDKDCTTQSCHTVFGMVIDGLSTVDQISEVDRGSNDKPIDDVRLVKISRN